MLRLHIGAKKASSLAVKLGSGIGGEELTGAAAAALGGNIAMAFQVIGQAVGHNIALGYQTDGYRHYRLPGSLPHVGAAGGK